MEEPITAISVKASPRNKSVRSNGLSITALPSAPADAVLFVARFRLGTNSCRRLVSSVRPRPRSAVISSFPSASPKQRAPKTLKRRQCVVFQNNACKKANQPDRLMSQQNWIGGGRPLHGNPVSSGQRKEWYCRINILLFVYLLSFAR